MLIYVVLKIFPRDLACMSTMMTFEYLSQLCQNKEQVFSQPGGPKDSRGEQNTFQNLQLETCVLQ